MVLSSLPQILGWQLPVSHANTLLFVHPLPTPACPLTTPSRSPNIYLCFLWAPGADQPREGLPQNCFPGELPKGSLATLFFVCRHIHPKRHFVKPAPRSLLLWATCLFILTTLTWTIKWSSLIHSSDQAGDRFQLSLTSLIFLSCVMLAKFTCLRLSFFTFKMGGCYTAHRVSVSIQWLSHINAANSGPGTQ